MPCCKLLRVLVQLDAQKYRAQEERQQDPSLGFDAWLSFAASSASTTVTLEQISTKVLNAPIGSLKCTSCGCRPGDGPETEHDVRADEPREEHDLGREKQPQARLAVRNRQCRLILEFGSGFVTHIFSLSVVRCPLDDYTATINSSPIQQIR